jgi:hypothetical protein
MDDGISSRRYEFMRLTEKQRFERLFEVQVNMAANNAVNSKLLADALQDIQFIKGELDGIARRKEDTLSTGERIDAALSKRNAGWLWYRDKILPGTLTAIQTGIVLALLYLAFGGTIPP